MSIFQHGKVLPINMGTSLPSKGSATFHPTSGALMQMLPMPRWQAQPLTEPDLEATLQTPTGFSRFLYHSCHHATCLVSVFFKPQASFCLPSFLVSQHLLTTTRDYDKFTLHFSFKNIKSPSCLFAVGWSSPVLGEQPKQLHSPNVLQSQPNA